jgi:hypothetical protein
VYVECAACLCRGPRFIVDGTPEDGNWSEASDKAFDAWRRRAPDPAVERASGEGYMELRGSKGAVDFALNAADYRPADSHAVERVLRAAERWADRVNRDVVFRDLELNRGLLAAVTACRARSGALQGDATDG